MNRRAAARNDLPSPSVDKYSAEMPLWRARRKLSKDADRTFDSDGFEPLIQISTILGRAYLQCVASGLRFGYTATRTVFYGQSRVLDALRYRTSSGSLGKQALRVILDESRARLREIVDAGSDESRRLRAQLADLQDAMRAILDTKDVSGNGHTRYWKVKN